MTRLLQLSVATPPVPSARGRVAVETLGCKLNQAESDALARGFKHAGYTLVDSRSPADIFILNSCTVTHEADRKARQTLRRARRLNPDALTILTGCYPSVAPEEAAAKSGADLILGNRDKPALIDQVTSYRDRLAGTETGIAGPALTAPDISVERRTRAFVKIQDGCNDFCAFCIVPVARGRSVSRPPEAIIAEIAERVAEGVQEVVLTGVQIGWYGRDGGLRRAGWDLPGLLRGILTETTAPRIRLTSIHPRDVTGDLIDVLAAEPRVCPHLHMSLQSGSDRILVAMRRRTTAEGFLATVGELRACLPDIALTTDLIVGFPGETDADFDATCRVSREAAFAQIHVFRYSPRAGTPAAALTDAVPETAKSDRAARLGTLAKDLEAEFQRQAIGKVRDVLFESSGRPGYWTGLTDNYLRVEMPSGTDLNNQIRRVRITGQVDGRLTGLPAG